MKLLAKYQNGNYTVRLFDDGTKIRMNDQRNVMVVVLIAI